ncbi:hypothetical protein B7463_g8574, partial [Scytalidium lignicola]
MSEFENNESGEYNSDEDDQGTGLMNFSIEMDEGADGDTDSTYRTQNDPRRPQQRQNIVERKGAVDVRCLAIDVIHGYLEPDSEPATLLVFEFRLDSRKRARRIAEAHLGFTFASDNGGTADPEVIQIAPKGRMILVPTKQQESSTVGGDANVGGGVLGATLGGSVKWEKTVSRETSDATAVVGSIDLVGRNYGGSNSASWTLLENRTMGTGVPAFVRTAVLLKREDEENEFRATFKIQAQADMVSSFQKVFGRTPKDDPILYDPTLKPTNKLRKYDCNHLGDVDLNELSAVAFVHDG